MNAKKKTEDASRPDKIVLTDVQYEYVYQTGSNIPVRVPKNSSARALPSASEVTVLSKEAFQEVVRRGQTTPRRQ